MNDAAHAITADPGVEPLRHVHIEIGDLTLDYQARPKHADDIAGELAMTHPHAVITIDDNVPDDLPPLPCGELWQ